MTIDVPLPGGAYTVQIGAGLLRQTPALIRECCPAAAYVVITDSTVEPLYAHALAEALKQGTPTVLLSFPAGEWNKTRATWTRLTDRMLDHALGRDAAVVAVGGGVVGDMAGFVAATYARGIPHVQVPTSLLAMIDSSIGGKTGVDTQHGKNLVGAFHQPRGVFVDVATLSTLPSVQLAAGVSEALKHGAIADRVYFDRLLTDAPAITAKDIPALTAVVQGSLEIKAGIVAEDEREAGRRSTLNFGHTVGHALEAVTGYDLLHGEAVALGMLAEARLGRASGVTEPNVIDEIRSALHAFELPAQLPDSVNPEALLEAMHHDKKVRDGTVRFAFISEIGTVARGPSGAWTHDVASELILKTLRSDA